MAGVLMRSTCDGTPRPWNLFRPPMKPLTLDVLRRYAVARTLFRPTTLPKAIARLGFIQADPIRAPARAQDLTLRHRVIDYRAGDLERRYPRLGIEEDFFVNYGFIPRATHRLMHPRTARRVWTPQRRAQAEAVLEFVRERGVVHPRDVDLRFAHGKSAQLVRRDEQRQHATARRDALSWAGPHRPARGRNPTLRSSPGARSRRQRRCRVRCLARHRRAPVCAIAATDARQAREPARARHAAMAGGSGRCCATGARATVLGHRRRHGLALARGREPGIAALRSRQRGQAARAIRPDRLGPAAVRAPLGMVVSLRGLYASRACRVRGYYALPMLWAMPSSAGGTSPFVTVGWMRASATRAAVRRAVQPFGARSTMNSTG